MKQTTYIIGINFLVLVISILWIKAMNNVESELIYFFPVFALTALNIALCLVYFYKGNKVLSKTFMLAGLIVLVVGTSSCVSIKPRRKKKKKKIAPVEQPIVFIEHKLNHENQSYHTYC
jgi:hypothetical protein